MFKINRLQIKIFDKLGNEYGNEFIFDDGLNIILGINGSGKSTVINAIYYVLGMEELLKDGKNIKGLKPALRKDFLNNGENIKILDSYILLELENSKEEIITLKRWIISSRDISEGMITIFESSLDQIETATAKDYFLHINSATHDKGFYKYFEMFLGIKLPKVLGYLGEEKKLYIQTIFSAFFIEQTKGWTDFLAMIPTYFGIKEVRQKAIEFILGLDRNEIVFKKLSLENSKSEEIINWKANIQILNNLIKGFLIEIEGNTEKYVEYNYDKIKIYVKKINSKLSILDYIQELNEKLVSIRNKNNFLSEDEVNETFLEIEEIQRKLVKYQGEQRILEKEILKIDIQEENIYRDLNKLGEEIVNFKDIERLKELGSEEKHTLEKCPCCKSEIKDAFYPEIVSVMSSEENIKYLDEKKKIFLISKDLLKNRKNELVLNLEVYTKEIKKLYDKLKILNTNLPKISIQKNLFREEFQVIEEIENLSSINEKIRKILLDQKYISEQLVRLDIDLKKIPKNNISDKTKEKLKSLKKSLLYYLEEFNLNKENLDKTEISLDTYFPMIDDFNIKINISASDFIRIQWAYILSLVENSIFNKNILILDEPAQQNIAFNSLIELFKELNKVKNTQSIVTYAVNKEDIEKDIKTLKENKIKYIYIDEKSIKKISSWERK